MGRHLRAALVALHLVAVTFLALPSAGGGMNRRAWKDPTVQGEFAAWTERLRDYGVDVSTPELEETLWSFAVSYEGLRARVIAPFKPWFRITGTWQSWRMFVAPHRYPSRMEIEVDRGNGFEPVYVERSPEHEWMRTWFDQDRMRSAVFRYGWPHYRASRDDFADWVALHATRDFPDAREMRVSFVKYRSPTPTEVRAGIEPVEKRDLVEIRRLGVDRRPP